MSAENSPLLISSRSENPLAKREIKSCSKGTVLNFGQLLGSLFVFHSWWYHRVQLSSFNTGLPNQLTALDDSLSENKSRAKIGWSTCFCVLMIKCSFDIGYFQIIRPCSCCTSIIQISCSHNDSLGVKGAGPKPEPFCLRASVSVTQTHKYSENAGQV